MLFLSPPAPLELADDDLMPLDEPATVGDRAENKPDGSEHNSADDADNTDREDEGDGARKWALNDPPKPRKISERKRADNAAFGLWIEENLEELSKEQTKLVYDNDKSVNALVRDFESKRIIASPRDYQLELFERAKTQNTIAVLDTGSGKTLIAALLLRWTIQNELENRSRGLPKRSAFFLVDKVALVFQQHAVLTCNLDYPIEKFCGEMVDEVSSKEFWDKTFAENMAIVCTADILYTCLHHSYIRMDQINLLIFDEAHHTKKNHPYARIIKDFYVEVDEEEKRPRILGMTASPVDALIDPRVAAAQLEALLHSQIATPADPAAVQHSARRATREMIVEYGRRPPDWETPLNKALRALVGSHDVFRKPFSFTATAAAELGPWCADRYWQLFFKEADVTRLEAKTERKLLFVAAFTQESMGRYISKVREAYELVNQHNFARPSLDRERLSSKVIQLVNTLRDQFRGVDSNRRCIVFAKQRNVASLLLDLLQQPEIKIQGLEPGILVGGGNPENGWDSQKVSFRDQLQTILKFKKGELNCVFATSVAEEGLDIPDCNVIIRYDLNDTLIQYIQSRGRARQDGSVYIHMAEQGNANHRAKLKQIQRSEEALRMFCEAMPDDRKLTGNDFNMDYFLRKERNQKQYTVLETGAKLNFKLSLVCLASFAASLPHFPGVSLTPEYSVLSVPGGFQCEVILPPSSPIRSAIGEVYGSKAVAKCSAAFEMCILLIKGKHLDQHLRPVFTKRLPAMRNARLAISPKKKAEYGMRIKPKIWSSLGKPTKLHVLALTLADPAALGRQSSPLLLLTRQQVPRVASFPLFFGAGRSSTVNCVPISGSVKLNGDSFITQFTTFTLLVFKDVFSKEYEATAAELPYFLAPTRQDHGFDFLSVLDPCHIIDWGTLRFVQENQCTQLEFNGPDNFFSGKFVCDPYDGARKFVLRGLRRDLKPTDPVPEDIVAPGHRAWHTTCEARDIANYSLSMWSKSRKHFTLREDQPVVEAELLPVRRNFLDDAVGDQDLESKRCFLILEPLRISPLPVNVVAMIYTFPSIIHRIEANLIALDACQMLGLNIRPDLALEALTKDSDNTDEHDAEQINFQRGMGNNYERLEFLGDSFLKMATTIAIFILIPDKGEFEYHVERMLLICNRNLFNNALEVKLEEYIRSVAFNRRSWYPEGLTLKKGKRKDTATKHVLGDKSIADVCEALIGAAYLTAQEHDRNDFDLAVRAVTIMVRDKRHTMTRYSDYAAAYTPPDWQIAPSTSTQLDMAERFRQRLGYSFRYPRLLRSAFQHPTYPSLYEKLPSYQRLEFLGDALLDMACVEYLFHTFPGADPQWLTEHKMAMVSNQFLGCLAVYLGFHKALTYWSPAIQRQITDYATEFDEALQAAKKDAALGDGDSSSGGGGGGEFARDFWMGLSHPPKCLADVLESYLGAIFVDSGFSYATTIRPFFDAHVRPWFADMRLYDTFASKHPVTFLAHRVQSDFRCRDCRLLVREMAATTTGEGAGAAWGPDGLLSSFSAGGGGGAGQTVVCAVRVHGQTVAHSVGTSSRYGKITAAKKALRVLEKMEVDEFRRAYGCTCALERAGAVGAEGESEGEEVVVGDLGTAI